MNPKLLVLAGPLKDSTFALPVGEVPIGRDPANLLAITDPALSRRHCVLLREGERFKIKDLESRNGTFVNGAAIKEAWLNHADQISIGDSVLVLLTEDQAEELGENKVEFDDSLTHATAQLRPQDVLYLDPDRMLSQLPATSRVARNLNALLKISQIVHAIQDLPELQSRILDLIFEVAPAERGAILLGSKGHGQFDSVFARHRVASTQDQPVRVSRTISDQVLTQGIAILGSDVPGSDSLGGVESLVVSKVRSLLCVPLPVFGKVIGCIYLDTTSMTARFDEDHLQLVAAVAGISAIAFENARRLLWLEQENLRLTTEINLEHNMVGDSRRMKEVYQLLARVAPSDATVLIEGESGTGKEVAARVIHRNSPRAAKPFVPINCAAIPEGLLESELFGYEKGAFTGAAGLKKGRLEVADGGIVFLDEIGELAPPLQVKLLRVLQERQFERVGGTRPISVDIRLLAATNKDLQEAVKNGSFRQDLFYRLNVVSVEMPALRERVEDIPMLAEYFIVKHSKKCNVKPKPLSPEAVACMTNYDWPGNVRELENAMERALVLSNADMIRPEDLPDALLERDAPPGVATAKYHEAVKDLKRQLIRNALDEARGNYTEAARLLGVHPNYLHRLIRNLELKESIRSSSRSVGTKSSAIRP